jgi:transcriptional regulator with XRE-family HTH domain
VSAARTARLGQNTGYGTASKRRKNQLFERERSKTVLVWESPDRRCVKPPRRRAALILIRGPAGPPFFDEARRLDSETQNVINVLKQLIRASNLRNRDIERRLGLSASYLSRLFTGKIELRFDHIVDIGKVLGLEVGEVFRFVYPYPKDPPSAGAVRLREVLSCLQADTALPPSTAYEARTEADLDRQLEQALWRVLLGVRFGGRDLGRE